MRKFFYFLLAAMTMTFAACGDGNEPTIDDNGALKGKFSVDDKGTQVQFSRGNLQYVGTWQFATNQWDYFGESQSDDHRDLFGWGTGHGANKVSDYEADYATFTDWGTNAITNGGNTANMWRTLTKDEWVYLFYGRTDAAKLFSLGKVKGVNGTILLPDNWSGDKYDNATDGLTDQGTYYYNSNGTNFTLHTYEGDAWTAMEKAGAVFLPAAGYRIGTDVLRVGSLGYYWSTTPYDTNYAYYLDFGSYGLDPQGSYDRYYGLSVRLVHDIQ